MFSFAVDPQAILHFAALVAAPILLPLFAAVVAAVLAWRSKPAEAPMPRARVLQVVRESDRMDISDHIAAITGTVATVN